MNDHNAKEEMPAKDVNEFRYHRLEKESAFSESQVFFYSKSYR